MAIWIRPDDEKPDGSTLVIHGGMGNIDVVRRAAIQYYPDYRTVRDDGFGYFTVSVFATVHEIDEQEIIERLVHGSYGVASASTVGNAFDLIPTSDDDSDMSEEMKWLQDCHFDICLPDLPDPRLLTMDPLDDQDLLVACQDHLAPHLETLLGLFTRHQKT